MKNLLKEINKLDDVGDINQVLIKVIDKMKLNSKFTELEFKNILGQISIYGTIDAEDKKLKQMELIHNFQYRQTGSFETALLDLLYKSSKNNLDLLSLSYPFEVEAFTKYGRESVNILKIKIDELNENMDNSIDR